jgi:hypothetical protein
MNTLATARWKAPTLSYEELSVRNALRSVTHAVDKPAETGGRAAHLDAACNTDPWARFRYDVDKQVPWCRP